jgi:hypothetical protein
MRQLIVGNDLDGVGHVFGDSCKMHLDHTGRGHLWKSGPNPEPYWDWYKDWGWTSKEFVEFCHEAADCGCLFNGPVRDGWLEMMYKQAEEGHYIVIITDRPFGSTPEVSEKITVDWLHEHDVYYDELIFSADKTCRWTDFFIDDKIENYDALTAAGTKAFLLNRPWNQVSGGDARNRIDDLHEFTDAINEAVENGFYDQSFA